ncbi:MAG: DUF4167 domain-containing protein [Rickettsiales bacterium]
MRRKPNHKMNNRRRYRGDGNNGQKIKSVTANRDKYQNLSRDALASGDRVEAEFYAQHVDHYNRVLMSLQEDDSRNNARDQQQENAEAPQEASSKAKAEEAAPAKAEETVEEKPVKKSPGRPAKKAAVAEEEAPLMEAV